MSNVSRGVDLLVAAAQDYSAARAGGDVARIEGLNLFVAMREVQTMAVGAQAMTVMEVTAAARPARLQVGVLWKDNLDSMPFDIV